jgi:hypothetical protein
MRRNMTPQTEPTLSPPHRAHAAAPRRRVAFRAHLETLEDRVVLATGCRWEDVPPPIGCSGQTANRFLQLRRWGRRLKRSNNPLWLGTSADQRRRHLIPGLPQGV